MSSKDEDLRRKAGRRLWIGVPGTRVDEETAALLREIRPGGIVLFRRNIESLDQTRRLIASLRKVNEAPLLISVDQEGGLILRFYRELTVFPGNMALGAASVREPSLGEHLAEEQGLWMGRELRDLDIDINLAPVLDLATRGGNPSGGIRSFGAFPELAEKLGSAYLRGLRKGGVHGCLKHFPGLGDATVDSHLDLPRIAAADQERHLRPFKASLAAGATLVMSSHVIYERLDPKKPATLSRHVVPELLRRDLGFSGVVMTDDLEMGAMTRHFEFDQMIREAATAEHDVFSICHRADLQRRAHRLIAEGISTHDPVFDTEREVESHLKALAPLQQNGGIDNAKADSVAEAIAGRAITIVRDDRRLLPLPRSRKALLLMPTLRGETGAENPLRGEEDGSALILALGEAVDVHSLPTEPDQADLDAALLRAETYERLLVVLTNARFQRGQTLLARRAVKEHPGAILLPIRNPFDLEVVPIGTLHTAVLSYGFRPVQLRALARALLGELPTYGRLPVEICPLDP